ncbi:MAG: Formate dehydrogenase chain [Nevskia sp.]|nr:Formate dehydrogenase chain [Nevskia sp.]
MSLSRNNPAHAADAPAAMPAGTASVAVHIARNGQLQAAQDQVAEEVPLALLYNGEPHVVMMATPGDLEDFARGFSVTEEIVAGLDEIADIHIVPIPQDAARGPIAAGFEISLRVPAVSQQALQQRQRNMQGRTGCGLCGAQTIGEALRIPRRVPAGTTISLGALKRALDALRQQQQINRVTGATHAAAWATPDGLIVSLREDVGRHNALDKLIGHLLQTQADLARGFLVITSRASYEMVLKASMVGIPMVVAISAPTAYAIRIAEEAGMTLIGFAQGDRHVVYSCPGRLGTPAPGATP